MFLLETTSILFAHSFGLVFMVTDTVGPEKGA